MSYAVQLRQCHLFTGLTDEYLARLEPHVKRRSFEAGDYIFREGEHGNALFVILDGEVKLSIGSATQQEIVLAVLRPGDSFGELALLDGQPRSANAVATQATHAITILRDDFLALLDTEPGFGRAVMGSLSNVIRQMNVKLSDVAMLDVHRRIAKVLAQLVKRHGKQIAEGILIDREFSEAELAAMVGLYPTEVARLLANYQYEDLIRKQGGKLVLRRPAAFGIEGISAI